MLLAASPLYEQIQLAVPAIPSIPEAPDIVLVSLHVTLDPTGLRYYETRHDRRVAYDPTGVILPHHSRLWFYGSLLLTSKSNEKGAT